MNTKSNGLHRKDGIALIVVTGFLAMLVIMCVAFAVVMRTERLGARNYKAMVRAKFAAETAINRIIAETVETEMGGMVYPGWNALPDGGGTGNFLMNLDAVGSPYLYVPGGSLTRDARLADTGEWHDLYDNTTGQELIGQYAFILVNSSGLLDANFVGEHEELDQPRRYGVDPGEITFHPDIQSDDVSNPNIKVFRDEYVRFDSLPELYYLGTDGTMDSPGYFDGSSPAERRMFRVHAPGAAWPRHMNTFHVYSRFPIGYAEDDLTANENVAFIGGDPANWDEDVIIDALGGMSPDPIPDLNAFFDVMCDFADDGYVPRNLESFHAKPIPMINEVVVSNSVQLEVLSDEEMELQHRVYVNIETWYPFPNDPDNPQFTVHIGEIEIDVDPDEFSFPGNPEAVESPSPIDPDEYEFHVSTYVYQNVTPITVDEFGIPDMTPVINRVTVNLKDGVEVQYNDGNDNPVVDRVNNFDEFVIEGPIEPGEESDPAAVSAFDPRINWDAGDEDQWVSEEPTLGEINKNVEDAVDDGEIDIAEVGLMFSPRRPFLSAGELSFLLYDKDKPWRTIRLLGPDDDETARVMDRLTVHSGKYFRSGLVNINTENRDVLRAVFWRAPVDRYPDPDDDNPDTITQDEAGDLADLIMGNISNAGFFVNLSDIARINRADIIDILGVSDDDKFTAESAVRNTVGLLGTRHNLFTILVAARVFEEGFDPDVDDPEDFVAAEQSAVVVVWRDPFKTTDNTGAQVHKKFIRFFHWLTE